MFLTNKTPRRTSFWHSMWTTVYYRENREEIGLTKKKNRRKSRRVTSSDDGPWWRTVARKNEDISRTHSPSRAGGSRLPRRRALMSAYSRDRICASVPSGRVDREEGNALVGTSPPMTDPYSTAGERPTDTPQKRARRGWQGCFSFSLFLFLSERDESFRDIPPTDRDSPDAEKSDCSERSDWFDVAENSNAESASRRNDCQSTKILSTARKKTVHRREAHLAWWIYGDDNIFFSLGAKAGPAHLHLFQQVQWLRSTEKNSFEIVVKLLNMIHLSSSLDLV